LTRDQQIDKFIGSFTFLMDSAMIGVGVGFDTKGSQLNLETFTPNKELPRIFVIPDTREGWVQSLQVLLE
jgi:ribonucleoside-triphosphate reductase (thioredoxin)